MIFYFMVLLCLSLTSLVTCSQDTCPVVSYIGRRDINNQVKGSAILGYSYKNFTTDTIHKCFSACVQDCRCVSCQHSGTRCELVDENRLTAPGSFKEVPGYVYLELKQEFRYKPFYNCQCFNGCCRSSLCQNGGTCIELCDNVTRKFECKCTLGYMGRVCETPKLYSCAQYKSKIPPDLCPILAPNENIVTHSSYCDTTSEPGMVWILIESFALSQRVRYMRKDFFENFPVNEINFNWNDYRLSLPDMQHIKSHSTHWRATCNYDKDGLNKTDLMKGRISDIDIITYHRGSNCFRVDYVNIRGIYCSNCTTHIHQDSYRHIFVDSRGGKARGCDINFVEGAVGGFDLCENFGFYDKINPAHRCSASRDSTTQWWLGLAVQDPVT